MKVVVDVVVTGAAVVTGTVVDGATCDGTTVVDALVGTVGGAATTVPTTVTGRRSTSSTRTSAGAASVAVPGSGPISPTVTKATTLPVTTIGDTRLRIRVRRVMPVTVTMGGAP